MSDTFIKLISDCKGTIIPAGDERMLAKGSEVELVQKLGGSITVQFQGILYRIGEDELSKLDPAKLETLGILSENSNPAKSGDHPFSEQLLWDALKTCFDPEIPINIVDLGLVYDLGYEKSADGAYDVTVKMTLTAQGCGMGPVIAEDARRKISALGCVKTAKVDIVWDPPWTPHMISQEGRQQLGIV